MELYLEMDSHVSEMLEIDNYLGCLGVYAFEIKGNKIAAEMEDGLIIEYRYSDNKL